MKPKSGKDDTGYPYTEIWLSPEEAIRFTYVPRAGSDCIVIQRVKDGLVLRRADSGEGIEIPVSRFENGEVLLALGAVLRNGQQVVEKREWGSIQRFVDSAFPDDEEPVKEGPPTEDTGLPQEEFPSPLPIISEEPLEGIIRKEDGKK